MWIRNREPKVNGDYLVARYDDIDDKVYYDIATYYVPTGSDNEFDIETGSLGSGWQIVEGRVLAWQEIEPFDLYEHKPHIGYPDAYPWSGGAYRVPDGIGGWKQGEE